MENAKTLKRLKVIDLYSNKKFVPFIKLSGKWLAENGFVIGDYVEVITSEEGILIKKSN